MTFQGFKDLSRLTSQWLLYLIFCYTLVDPLERVVPTSDDYKLVPIKHENQYVCVREVIWSPPRPPTAQTEGLCHCSWWCGFGISSRQPSGSNSHSFCLLFGFGRAQTQKQGVCQNVHICIHVHADMDCMCTSLRNAGGWALLKKKPTKSLNFCTDFVSFLNY